jgi:hypothetical protein
MTSSGRRSATRPGATCWISGQFAQAIAQLKAVGAEWDARLGRIKRIAERIEQTKNT